MKKIGRGAFAAAGVGLMAFKYNLDRFLALLVFHRTWVPTQYWFPHASLDDFQRPGPARTFFLTLLAVSIPFIASGVVLTLLRLRSAGLPSALVALFFVPFVNLLFFAILCLLPEEEARGDSPPAALARFVPRSAAGSAALGVALSVLVCGVLALLSTSVLKSYGWGLFAGLPFFMGMGSVLLYGYHEPRSLGGCLGVACLSIGFFGAALFALAMEGLICLLMAAPIGLVLAVVGGLAGYAIQLHARYGPPAFAAGVAALPLILLLEARAPAPPELVAVRTAIDVEAPPAAVWAKVIAFSELPPPEELLFRAGIAYPTRARIEGRGPGAIRHCVFSTGSFVEKITVWEDGRRLAFDVVEQPEPMSEMSPYRNVHPPHLDGLFRTSRGEFSLTPLAGNRTRLEGTTWYRQTIWPARYWRVVSDHILHAIHLRVLHHISRLSATIPS